MSYALYISALWLGPQTTAPYRPNLQLPQFTIAGVTLSSLVLGHFVDDPDDMTKFRPIRTKIKCTSLLEHPLAKNGHMPARRPENGPENQKYPEFNTFTFI